MKECAQCMYYDNDTDEFPCSQCLDSYVYLPKFRQKEEENKEEKEQKIS